jgi:hypothetical protein
MFVGTSTGAEGGPLIIQTVNAAIAATQPMTITIASRTRLSEQEPFAAGCRSLCLAPAAICDTMSRFAFLPRDENVRGLGLPARPSCRTGVVVVSGSVARGAILTRSVDVSGRVTAYAFRDGAVLDVERSANAMLLRDGMAYPLAYDTQPEEHRAAFATIAIDARTRRAGIWRIDHTASFSLASEGSIGPRGALILPKLFRRCVSFLAARFRGGLRRWLKSQGGHADDVVICDRRLTRMSDLLVEAGTLVRSTLDATRLSSWRAKRSHRKFFLRG